MEEKRIKELEMNNIYLLDEVERLQKLLEESNKLKDIYFFLIKDYKEQNTNLIKAFTQKD